MSAFSAIFEQFFQLEEHNSDIVTELRAGVVTFLPRLILFLSNLQCCRVLEWILAPMGRGFAILPDSRWNATYFQYCGWYGSGVYILSTQTVLQ